MLVLYIDVHIFSHREECELIMLLLLLLLFLMLLLLFFVVLRDKEGRSTVYAASRVPTL
jgi:hypothetical protein